MKFILTISFFLLFALTVWSRSDGTPLQMITYGVASEARAGFEATGSWLPMDKLTSLEQYALRAKYPKELVVLNSLAGVPGAPILKADGVKVKYPGFRLYAISRIPNFERAYTPEGKKTGGRYAVLFKEQNGSPVIMEIPWIVESEAQIILQQIGGFDPKKAPFVFEDTYVKLGGNLEMFYENNNPAKGDKHPLSPTESKLRNTGPPEASRPQDNSREDTSLERPDRSSPPDASNSSDTMLKRLAPFSWGIIGGSIGLLVIALAAWLKLRNSTPAS